MNVGTASQNGFAPSQYFKQQQPESSHPNSSESRQARHVEEVKSSFSLVRSEIDKRYPGVVTPVAADGAIFANWTDDFLATRKLFQEHGKPADIEIGYHYTSKGAMAPNWDSIPYKGLSTSTNRRAFFGKGIYLANNPHAFRVYGQIGLVVLHVKGLEKRVDYNQDHHSENQSVDTFIGNKPRNGSPYYNEIVIRGGHQALPLLQYNGDWANNADLMWQVHFAIHEWIESLSAGSPLRPIPQQVKPSFADIRYGHTLSYRLHNKLPWNPCPLPQVSFGVQPTFNTPFPPSPFGPAPNPQAFASASGMTPSRFGSALNPTTSQHGGPTPLAFGSLPNPFGQSPNLFASNQNQQTNGFYQGQPGFPPKHPIPQSNNGGFVPRKQFLVMEVCNPIHLKNERPSQNHATVMVPPKDAGDCPICFDPLDSTKEVVAVNTCKHMFHKECLSSAFQLCNKKQCPVCRATLGEPKGSCPKGTMEVHRRTDKPCTGFESLNTLCISYTIEPGVEAGKTFSGTTRNAYVPDNDEGRRLVKRLRYAFRRGLTFCLGNSLTTGRDGVCWASIHHKTSTSGGTSRHGWPDPNFFNNCNGELDALGVPPAKDL